MRAAAVSDWLILGLLAGSSADRQSMYQMQLRWSDPCCSNLLSPRGSCWAVTAHVIHQMRCQRSNMSIRPQVVFLDLDPYVVCPRRG